LNKGSSFEAFVIYVKLTVSLLKDKHPESRQQEKPGLKEKDAPKFGSNHNLLIGTN